MSERGHTSRLNPVVDRIIESALIVLERKGITVRDERLRRRLASEKGIRTEGIQVRVAQERTAVFLKAYCSRRRYHPQTEFSLSSTGHAHHIMDWDGACRPITLHDLEEGARLTDALACEGIGGSGPGIPQDVPPPLQGIAQLVAGAKYSRSFPNYALRTTCPAEELIAECYHVLGLEYPIGVHVVSPLRFEGQEIEIALHMIQRLPHAAVHVGTMPILGVSAPATIVSGFVVAVAEVLGAGIVFETLGATELHLAVNAYPIDMRTTAFVYGTPANIAINLLEIAVNKRLKTEVPSKSFNTMSQQVDPQAAGQKALFTGLLAARGKRMFSGAGSLSLDETFSPVQLVIDSEIFRSLKKSLEIADTSFNKEHLLLNAILDNTSGCFLTEPSTLEHFRELQWDSLIFPSRRLQQWRAVGSPECIAIARDRGRKLLAEHSYVLEKHKADALETILAQARTCLVGSS
jgi:trimethylamine:corrinoid methyltransferase-like protein